VSKVLYVGPVLTGFAIFAVSLSIGLATAVRRLRLEYEADERPSDLVLLTGAVRNPLFLVTIAVLIASPFLADSAGVAVAFATSAVLVAGGVVGARAAVRNRGIEREQLLVASAIGFLATVSVCGVWSMFEVFADAPLISMRVPWTVGIVVLIGSLAVQRRRAS